MSRESRVVISFRCSSQMTDNKAEGLVETKDYTTGYTSQPRSEFP